MSQSGVLRELSVELAAFGLLLRGGFAVDPVRDQAVLDRDGAARSLVLIGNAGSEMWEKSGDEVRSLGSSNPLDRWTRSKVEPIAGRLGGTALFPFDGPPYWPFQQWAARAEGVRPSPLGILMHPTFGLWHAYRAAILLSMTVALPKPETAGHPCDTCVDRPCLSACPVGAFTESGYAVDRCVAHVVETQPEFDHCYQAGCRARLACPVGAGWRYGADHARFHMRAFIGARLSEFSES